MFIYHANFLIVKNNRESFSNKKNYLALYY